MEPSLGRPAHGVDDLAGHANGSERHDARLDSRNNEEI
jgi:hypothetical protein